MKSATEVLLNNCEESNRQICEEAAKIIRNLLLFPHAYTSREAAEAFLKQIKEVKR